MRSPDDRGGRSIAKTRQLCAQVHDALSYALGESSDPVLMDLVLDRVEPMQDDKHVLVVMQDPCGHGLVASLAALDRARGFLREAVAEAVTRRRVPQLSFTVMPAGGAP
ncbi:MAG: ribosome-binding factor A [Planctomycetes bacterium]|nr:ribosome-binding factor A [Planctomycetota bacterium]